MKSLTTLKLVRLLVAMIAAARLVGGAPPAAQAEEPMRDGLAPLTSGAPGDEYWVAGFQGRGMNNLIDALAVDGHGNRYAAGNFTRAGGVAANRIARWNGTTWHPLGSGTDSAVSALAFTPDRSLYAGGFFTTAGDKISSSIARWMGEVEYKKTWLSWCFASAGTP